MRYAPRVSGGAQAPWTMCNNLMKPALGMAWCNMQHAVGLNRTWKHFVIFEHSNDSLAQLYAALPDAMSALHTSVLAARANKWTATIYPALHSPRR